MVDAVFELQLVGTFRLTAAGKRVELSSRRAQALLAMLATAGSGERTRLWLQDRLWGSRLGEQAQASLRRELSSLRKLVNTQQTALLQSDHARVWLDLNLIRIDTREPGPLAGDEFLEGFDLPDEEGFEDWLRTERARLAIAQDRPAAAPPQTAVATPTAPLGRALTALALEPVAGCEAECEQIAERLLQLRWIRLVPAAAARYLLSGTLRGNLLSLSLHAAANSELLWTGRFPLGSDPAGQVALADRVLVPLRQSIAQSEQETARRSSDANPTVATLVWRSQWHMHRFTREDAHAARQFSTAALALDPDSPEALIQATWVRLWELWVTRAEEGAVREARAMAQKSIVADHGDARGHMLAGIAEVWLKQPLRAEALLRRAVELDPSLIMARAQLSCALYQKLNAAEAEQQLVTALQLSPNDQYHFFMAGELATTCLMQGKWAEALLHAEESLAGRRSYLHAHVAKTNALVRLDRMSEAAAALADLYRANPSYRPEFIDWIPFLDSTWHNFFKDGLNRAAAWTD